MDTIRTDVVGNQTGISMVQIDWSPVAKFQLKENLRRLIFYYDNSSQTVRIMRIWDSRMNPNKLTTDLL